MAFQKILLEPGINTLPTPTLNRAGWSASNLIRFKDGYIESLGGWQKFNASPVVGVGRSLHAWLDLDANRYLAVGTNERLQLFTAGSLYDITPLESTQNLTNPFSTTISTTTVNVNDTAHGLSVGDWIYCVMPIAIGGIVLFGYYQVVTVVDADNYRITSASAATSTVSGGGTPPVFNTTNGSATVTVTLVNHGYSVGQIFTVQISTSVASLTLLGEYIIATTPTADTFTITASGNASATTSATENSGDTRLLYLLPSGPASAEALTGWGSGGWGEGGWGESSGTVAINPPRIWSLDNFGEILLAVYTNGGLYYWQPPDTNTRAAIVGTAPIYNTGMFVAMPQAQVVLYGSETGGTQDPLLIRWSDVGSYTDYTATVTNQAGSFRLSRGSAIVGARLGPISLLFWTDVDLWAAFYQGPPFIYDFKTVGQNCGLLAKQAVAPVDVEIYWMSLKGFFVFNGSSVTPLPCAVWDNVFPVLDTDNQDKCVAGADTPFNEVFFFFPTVDGDGEINAYVKFNRVTRLWDYGELVRTGWIDQSLFGTPLGIDADGYVQQHEQGYDNDTSAMSGVNATSGYADIAEGLLFAFVDQIIPDFKFSGNDPSVDITVLVQDYPGDTPREYGPFTCTAETKFISLRTRGRQMAFKITGNTLGTFWRLGAVRYRTAPAGRR